MFEGGLRLRRWCNEVVIDIVVVYDVGYDGYLLWCKWFLLGLADGRCDFMVTEGLPHHVGT